MVGWACGTALAAGRAARVIRLAALLLALGCGGCAPDLQALAADPNAICIHLVSMWMTVDVDRNHGCARP